MAAGIGGSRSPGHCQWPGRPGARRKRIAGLSDSTGTRAVTRREVLRGRPGSLGPPCPGLPEPGIADLNSGWQPGPD